MLSFAEDNMSYTRLSWLKNGSSSRTCNMTWPAQNPNVNPVENLWNELYEEGQNQKAAEINERDKDV